MSRQSNMTRREWLAAGGLGLSRAARSAGAVMQYRTLGRTGEKVSSVGLGGSHIGEPTLGEAEAIRLIRSALDQGLNVLDNSWDYHNGQSEIRMGKALRDGYRQKAFLMTKVDARTKDAAARQIDESLRRLETDHVDLLQFHEVIRFDDADRIFAHGGALEAFLDAKKAGKLRYIGFTGHKDPHIHLYTLQVADAHGFHFDTVQMPLNVMDAQFRSFEKLVLPEALKRDIAVLGMKSMGSGVILQSKTVTPVECLEYAMNLPVSVVITGIDGQKILDQALGTARAFRPLGSQQVTEILGRAAPAAAEGRFEFYKTTMHFDSTAKNPQWLGQESTRVQKPTKEK